ncbi:MAG: hypothetical protein OEW36_05285, partial [Hylemonella sp.]|nr:hypothetical protein [Hylemonella sp.]
MLDLLASRKRSPPSISLCASHRRVPFITQFGSSQPFPPPNTGILATDFQLFGDQGRNHSLVQASNHWTVGYFGVIGLGAKLGFPEHALKRKQLTKIVYDK